MGLEMVEIMLEVEDVFQIQLSESRLLDCRTVGDMHDLIVEELSKKGMLTGSTRGSLGLFLRFRRELSDICGIPRRTIRPTTLTDTVIHCHNRRAVWTRLSNRLGLELPKLEHSEPLRGVALVFSFTGSLIVILLTLDYLNALVALFVLLIGWLILYQLFLHGTPLLKSAVPCHCTTLRSLVWAVRRLNHQRLTEQGAGWSRREVWELFQILVAEQLDISPVLVTPDAQWIEDLRAD